MDEALVMYFCEDCEEEHYFPLDSLPGGDEHCEYCEHCGGRLVPEPGYELEHLRAENGRLRAALAEIASSGCRNYHGTDCATTGRDRHSEYAGDGWCDACKAQAALGTAKDGE